MSIFLVENSVMPTTAARVTVTTGTVIKTMLQIKAAVLFRIIEWGISFDAAAIAAPIRVELIETGLIFATVTQLAENDVTKIDDLSALYATYGTLGNTSGTGFTATAEGTIISARSLDPIQYMSVFSQPFVKQFPLGQYPVINISSCGRIRVTAAAALNCYCYMKLST